MLDPRVTGIRGLIVDMVEYSHMNYLGLRVYRDNIESFSEGQKTKILEHLYAVRDAIRDAGTNCHIEGVESAPPNRNSLVPRGKLEGKRP